MWKTSLQFMTYDKTKLIGILAGIFIAIFLIGAQMGILDGILDTSIGIVKNNRDYIYVVDKKSTSSGTLANVDQRVGYSLQSIPDIGKIYPVIVTMGTIKLSTGTTLMSTIIGVQYPEMIGGPQKYSPETNLSDIQNNGAMIIDAGDVSSMDNIKQGDYFSVNDKRVYVSGFSVGNPGLGQQNIITTIERARQLSGFSNNHVSAYMIKSSSMDPVKQKQIIRTINETIPNVKAWAGNEFALKSIEYTKEVSGVVAVFYMMMTFSLLTGTIIVGLTMFSSVNDRIRDYGTIKAIGGSNKLIAQLIIKQAVLYALLGFTISVTSLIILKTFMNSINQSMIFTPSLWLWLFIATIVLSLLGSVISMRKIFKLEPVQIFRM